MGYATNAGLPAIFPRFAKVQCRRLDDLRSRTASTDPRSPCPTQQSDVQYGTKVHFSQVLYRKAPRSSWKLTEFALNAEFLLHRCLKLKRGKLQKLAVIFREEADCGNEAQRGETWSYGTESWLRAGRYMRSLYVNI